MFAHNFVMFFHLIAFAAYLGAGFAQQQFMKRSAAADISEEIRYEYERLAASIVTKIELPAIMLSVLSGIAFIGILPEFMKQSWLHMKFTIVILLLILSHVEMFNARSIVKIRAKGESNLGTEIATRKTRHATFGAIGSLLVVILLVIVAFLRTA